MRGVFLRDQCEYRLEIEDSQWNQGASLTGVLAVISHSGSPHELPGLFLELAVGTVKKIKGKASDAYKLLFNLKFHVKELSASIDSLEVKKAVRAADAALHTACK